MRTLTSPLSPRSKDLFSSSSPRRTRVSSSPAFSQHCLSALSVLPAGCTTQACGFRDVYPDFTSQNYEVYCLSADSPAAQTKWQTKVPHLSPILGPGALMLRIPLEKSPVPAPVRSQAGAYQSADRRRDKDGAKPFHLREGRQTCRKEEPRQARRQVCCVIQVDRSRSHPIFPAPSLPSNSSRDRTRTPTQWLWMLPQIRKSIQLRMLLLQEQPPQRQRKRRKLELFLSLETSLINAFNSTILFSVVCRRIAVMDNFFWPLQ
jgi:hypothetical protein